MASVTVVVCGAPLAMLAQRLESCLREQGWETEWIATPSALTWLAGQPVADVVRSAPMPVDAPRTPGTRTAVIVFPATFNTISKLAHGIADTYAHSVMCESLGLGLPFVIVPMVNPGLRGHPAWAENVRRLVEAGAVFMDVEASAARGTGDEGTTVAADLVSVIDMEALVTAASGVFGR